MGLDNARERAFTEDMGIKRLLRQIGLGEIFGGKPQLRLSPMARERKRYEADMRQQFLELKKKGITIPVFTL
jgi:hypothetical protein